MTDKELRELESLAVDQDRLFDPCAVIALIAEVRRLRCCGNCEHFETVCGEGKCFVECEKPAWRFDKKVKYADGSGNCNNWEAADNG